LCGAEARTLDQVIAQARGLIAHGPATVVITSAELEGTPADEIETLAIERARAFRVRTPRVPISPNGTGDLFAALFAAACVGGQNTPAALSHAASAIFAALERTQAAGTEEMRIVESADALAQPRRRFEAVAVTG
jgi:pyridoxine kinase